ncbi:hypothetical protein AB3662_26370 [Sorangium cellulosum]|uniref:hypothetical protein n=1 Tax=Sorangium cellulosum TaxID=56 RepID=UPI003D9AB17F
MSTQIRSGRSEVGQPRFQIHQSTAADMTSAEVNPGHDHQTPIRVLIRRRRRFAA